MNLGEYLRKSEEIIMNFDSVSLVEFAASFWFGISIIPQPLGMSSHGNKRTTSTKAWAAAKEW